MNITRSLLKKRIGHLAGLAEQYDIGTTHWNLDFPLKNIELYEANGTCRLVAKENGSYSTTNIDGIKGVYGTKNCFYFVEGMIQAIDIIYRLNGGK